jgi:hypothetical protein
MNLPVVGHSLYGHIHRMGPASIEEDQAPRIQRRIVEAEPNGL